MDVRVECHAGYRGEEEPRRFYWDSKRIEVAEIRDRWLDPEHRYFKVLGDDGAEYLMRHSEAEDAWEMVSP